ALCRMAGRAADETWAQGNRTIRTRTAQGAVPLPIRTVQRPAGAELETGYDRLYLLNRISSELFSDKPFADALVETTNVVLALLEADYAGVYFCDDFGAPHAARRHGDHAFMGADAQTEESLVVAQALQERRITTI